MKHTRKSRRLNRQQSRRSGRSRSGRSGRSRNRSGGDTDLLLESKNYFLRIQNSISIFPLFTTGSPAREEYDKAMTEIKRIVEKYKIETDNSKLYNKVNDFEKTRANLNRDDIQQIVDLIDYIIRARNSKRTWMGNFKSYVVRPVTSMMTGNK